LVAKLVDHQIGEKDGLAWVQGTCAGGTRHASKMMRLDLLGLDLDTGEDIDHVISNVQKQGWAAIIYSTHSHMRTVSTVRKDDVVKHFKLPDDVSPTTEHAIAYLRETKGVKPDILDGATMTGEDYTDEGLSLFLQLTKPWPKFRIVLFLREPYFVGKQGNTHSAGVRKWHSIVRGAAQMLGVTADASCLDPSRLYFYGRHADDAEHCVHVVNGEPVDVATIPRIGETKRRSVVADNPYSIASAEMGGGDRRTYQTPGLGQFLGKNWRFLEADNLLMRLDEGGDRGSREGPGRHHTCPNESSHGDAGNADDRGCFVVNSSDNDGKGFILKCMHAGCAHLDRFAMVDLACVAAGIQDAEELEPNLAVFDEEDEGVEGAVAPAKIAPYANEAEAKAAIAPLMLGDGSGASEIVQRVVASNMSRVITEGLITQVSKKTKISKKLLSATAQAAATEEEDDTGSAYNDGEIVKALREMNRTYAVCEAGSKVRILREFPGDRSRPAKLMEIDGITTTLANKKVPVADGNGNTKLVPIFKLWREWPERRTYSGVEFEPDLKASSEGYYNYWRGFAVEPADGDWVLLHDHIKSTICHDNLEWYNWVMTWCAQLVQQPGVKLGSSVVICGKKGTGKSKLFDWLRKLFAPHSLKVSQRTHVTGHFNAHQSNIVLLVCEEAFWAGDQPSGGALKDMITSNTMMVEAKGIDAISTSNYVRPVFISNESWVVPAGLEDERRYFVLEARDTNRGDRAYFGAIDEQMESGGLEAMAKFFMEWVPPNGDWGILRSPPVTPWLEDQARESVNDVEHFLINMVEDGTVRLGKGLDEETKELNRTSETRLPYRLLRDALEEAISRRRGHPPKNISGAILAAAATIMPGALIGNSRPFDVGLDGKPVYKLSQRCFVIPPLDSIRKMTKRGLEVDLEKVANANP
jgi:hypothetical protein